MCSVCKISGFFRSPVAKTNQPIDFYIKYKLSEIYAVCTVL